VQESYLQKWFYAGLIFAFIRPILTSSFAEQLKEDMSHFVYMVRRTWNVLAGLLPNKQPSSNQKPNNQQTHQSQQSQQTNHGYNQYNDTTEQARRAEQARREAEARERRAEKEKENQQSRAEDPKPEPPTTDNRQQNP